MDELKRTMYLYAVIAASTYARGGSTRQCSKCGNEYTDHISPDADSIICCLCSMGLADGIVTEKVKRTRMHRISKDAIDIERRFQNGKERNSS